MQGIIKSKIYIPEQDITESCLRDNYEIAIFQESACQRCPYNKNKPNEFCEACQAYEGILKLWSKKVVQENTYYTIPSGNIKRAQNVTGIDFSTYLDKRCVKKFDNNLMWVGQLRHGEEVNGVKSADQQTLVDTWLQENKRYGFIQAPPRTGKTVCANYISMKLGYKTLIIAHQHELLENFMKSLKRDTNLLELQEQTGKEVAKILEKRKDLGKEDYDILMFTYQSFIREASNEDFKNYILGHYGLVIIDEAHQAGASAYAKFLGQLDCRYRLGMSATPLRKDALNFVLLNIIGPTTVKSQSTGLIPKIEIIETGIKSRYSYTLFVKAYQFLQRNEERNKLILKEVVKDLKIHKCIIIPVDSKIHMKALVDSINQYYKDDIAIGYHSGVINRKNILNEIDSGKYRVVVAIKSMIKQGIDLLSPSIIYIQIGMSAAPQPKGSPMFYQMSNRVCTPYTGKIQPVVKIFIDELPQSYGCFSSLFSKEIKPGLVTPKNGRPKYKMSQKAYDYAVSITKKIGMRRYVQSQKYNPDYDILKETISKPVELLSGSWL